ncbi:MAG: FtsQ-type POTRA domain-containing protein [Myxococcota bacterium]|nr:FtsQ-type POTRA domain-containing protein [Myxococcota bacterium]
MKRSKAKPVERAARVAQVSNRRRDAAHTAAQPLRKFVFNWRSALSLLRLLGSVALVAGLLAGGVLAYRYACQSPHFAVTDIRVSGNRTVTAQELLAAGELENAPNLFKVDANFVRQQLLAVPWIADARVTTRLPRTVNIEVVERRAAATLILEVPYLVDESGEIFKRFTEKDDVVAPIVTGFEREEFRAGEPMAAERLRDALDLARRYRKTSLEQTAPLCEVHRESDGGFSLVVGESGVYVKLGKGPSRPSRDASE